MANQYALHDQMKRGQNCQYYQYNSLYSKQGLHGQQDLHVLVKRVNKVKTKAKHTNLS